MLMIFFFVKAALPTEIVNLQRKRSDLVILVLKRLDFENELLKELGKEEEKSHFPDGTDRLFN
jgi:hypothetical protein